MQVYHLVCLSGVDSSPQPIAASRLVYTHETMLAFRTCFGLTLRLSALVSCYHLMSVNYLLDQPPAICCVPDEETLLSHTAVV